MLVRPLAQQQKNRVMGIDHVGLMRFAYQTEAPPRNELDRVNYRSTSEK